MTTTKIIIKQIDTPVGRSIVEQAIAALVDEYGRFDTQTTRTIYGVVETTLESDSVLLYEDQVCMITGLSILFVTMVEG